jgi:hypothetical protein
MPGQLRTIRHHLRSIRNAGVQGAEPLAGGLGVSPSFTSPRAGGWARRRSAADWLGVG